LTLYILINLNHILIKILKHDIYLFWINIISKINYELLVKLINTIIVQTFKKIMLLIFVNNVESYGIITNNIDENNGIILLSLIKYDIYVLQEFDEEM